MESLPAIKQFVNMSGLVSINRFSFRHALLLSLALHTIIFFGILFDKKNLISTELLFAQSNAPTSKQKLAIKITSRGISDAYSIKPAKKENPSHTNGQMDSHAIQKINKIIQSRIRYPDLAKKMDWQGKVHVTATVHPTGSVTEILVTRSSGHAILDRRAKNAVLNYKFPIQNNIRKIKLRFNFILRQRDHQ